jgi:hypothetical protein
MFDSEVAAVREARDAIVPRGVAAAGDGVVDVDELVGRKVRIKGHAKQAALACGSDPQRDERRGEQCAVLHDPQRPRLLRDKKTAIRSERHGGRRGKAAGDLGFGKSSREGGKQSAGLERAERIHRATLNPWANERKRRASQTASHHFVPAFIRLSSSLDAAPTVAYLP